MKRLISLLTVFACLVPLSSGQKGDDEFIYLQPDEKLYIRVIDHVYDGSNEQDRFYYLEQTLREVMEEFEFPMPYEIVRFPGNVPEGSPRLDIILNMWGYNGIGEIEAKFSASLRSSFSKKKNRLGYFRYADSALPLPQSLARKNFNDVLRKALIKMAQELDVHIQYEFKE